MPTIIRVNFRRDGHDKNGKKVFAYTEDLDLDLLTPRARAFAEALHDTMTHHVPGTTVLDVTFECGLTNAELADQPPRVPDAYRPVANPDQKATRTVHWSPLLDASTSVPLVSWLEDQARQQPPEWYPVGAPHRPRVPSWEAGAADQYLTRGQVLDYLAAHGAELGVQGWDTLRGTGVLPPDRHVAGRPQWLPQTVQAFATRKRDLWPVSRIAEHMGLAVPSAGAQMRRWGILAEGRQPGRTGENLYPADLVQAAHAARPGRGHRTDLREDADL